MSDRNTPTPKRRRSYYLVNACNNEDVGPEIEQRCLNENAFFSHENGIVGDRSRVVAGDILILKSGKSFVAFGEACGPCKENGNNGWQHRIDVYKWHKGKPTSIAGISGASTDYRNAVTYEILDQSFAQQKMKEINPTSDLLSELQTEMSVGNLHDSLLSNYQIILTGAPGTGKTYLARQLAVLLLGLRRDDELKNNPRFGFVQFHPAYDYTDFVEGLKPVKNDKSGQIGFEPSDGIFKKFCKDAGKYRKDEPCVFVIDEINRADLSRVFGELFYALEPDYRGEKGAVTTQYALLFAAENDNPSNVPKFHVPENVYIIGTMNDIDRSVESIDFALRRRFAWHEVEADEVRFDLVLNGVLIDHSIKEEAKIRYVALNTAIGAVSSLDKSYYIGPAEPFHLKEA